MAERALFIGTLEPLTKAGSSAPAVRVQAGLVPLLLPCEYQRRAGQPAPLLPELGATLAQSTRAPAPDHGGNALVVQQRVLGQTAGVARPRAPEVLTARSKASGAPLVASCSGVQSAGSANGRLAKKNYQAHKATYYVCTACGWSGSTKGRHRSARSDCNFIPCSMWFRPGDDKKKLVQDFLARCTATQREFGLPPEGERGLLDHDRLMVTVPEGLSEGHTFIVVSDARKQTLEVAVPRGLSGGAVLELELPAQERNKQRKATCTGRAAEESQEDTLRLGYCSSRQA